MSTNTDIQITKQGEIASFAYLTGDLGERPEYLKAVILGTLTKPLGTPSPIYARDPSSPNKYVFVGDTTPPPEFGEVPVTEKLHPAALQWLENAQKQSCPVTMVSKIDKCGRPDSLMNWDSAIIIEAIKLNNFDTTTDLMAFDNSEEVMTTGTFTVVKSGRVVSLLWSEEADSTVLAEILDVEYCGGINCGSCGADRGPCDVVYALQRANSGSPGLSGQMLVSVDAGSNWTGYDIDTLGGLDPNAFACVGNYIVVVSAASGSHHYANASDLDTWREVATGYVTGPRAIYAASARNVLVASAGGYIYRAVDFTSSVSVVSDNSDTTNNLNDIHGFGSTVVAVGDSNTVKYSINSGSSFGLLTGPRVGVNLTCVWAVSDYKWYVGAADGTLWYTQDRGVTWAQRALPNQSAIQSIWDIAFDCTDNGSNQHGAIAVQLTTNTGTVYRTITGGREWYESNSTPALINAVPTNERIRAVATCGYNNIVAGGLSSGSTDGILTIAKAGTF